MRTLNVLSTIALLSVAAFSGCFGEDEPTKAAFTCTGLDEQKTKYKCDAGPSTGEGLKFSWNFGDRTEPATGPVVEHTYQYLNGKYSVTLTVTDGIGKKSTMTQQVQVGTGSNTAPLLFLTADKRLVTPSESVVFDATQSFDADGDPLFFEWDFNSMLPDDELNKIENLGTQQYGRYAKGPPPSQNQDNGGGEGQTASGHNWVQEYEKALRRYLAEKGVTTLDGDHSGPAPEPRNQNFDGKSNDTGPIQLFDFPSPATYFVHVKVFDVKGDFAEGFIRIRVAETVPDAISKYAERADEMFQPKPFGEQAQGEATSIKRFPFMMLYPGNVTLTLSYVEDPAPGPLPDSMGIWLCTTTNPAKTAAECKGQGKGKIGPSPVSFQFDVLANAAGEAGGWTLLVSNEENSRAKAAFKVEVLNDLNPWAKQEAGLEVGHH